MNQVLCVVLWGEHTQTNLEMFVPVLFDIAFPHTHIYVYINPPMDDKKGTGVKKWNHAERNMSVLVKKKKKKRVLDNPAT